MDYETQTTFFQQLYPTKPLATFGVFIDGKPKISPFPSEDYPSDLANIESDDTILTDISSDPKFSPPPCDFDPSREDYPKTTVFIYNTNAPSHFKSEDMAAQSMKRHPEEQEQERPRKSLDFIRLNKQLIRRMKKVNNGKSQQSVKGSPGTSTTVTATAHRPSEPLRESHSNVQRHEVTTKNLPLGTTETTRSKYPPQLGTTETPRSRNLSLETAQSTRTTTSLVPIRPLRHLTQIPQNLPQESARSFKGHQAALIDRCVRKVIRTKPLAPLTSSFSPSEETPCSSPKSILKSSKFPRSAEVNDDDNITLKGSEMMEETSSETGFQQGEIISNADREALRQYIMEQQEAQRRRLLELRRRKRPRRALKPSSRPPPNHSSSMSLNISSTASDEDSGLEYTDEEFMSPY